jgi:hypothetical protein
VTALDLPNFGVFEDGHTLAVRGRWSLVTGGTVETRSRPRSHWLRLFRSETRTFPLLSGALIVGDPTHLTVGEIAVAVDKTRSVRLTVAEVTALGNRRYAVELIVSDLGDDAGPDQAARLEGHADRDRDGILRVVMSGTAPAGLGGPGSRIRLTAAFDR